MHFSIKILKSSSPKGHKTCLESYFPPKKFYVFHKHISQSFVYLTYVKSQQYIFLQKTQKKKSIQTGN